MAVVACGAEPIGAALILPDSVEKRSYSTILHPLNRPRRAGRTLPADSQSGSQGDAEPEGPTLQAASPGKVIGADASAVRVLGPPGDLQDPGLSPEDPGGGTRSSDLLTTPQSQAAQLFQDEPRK